MNPFQPLQPVNPKYFVNRKDVVEAFSLALRNASETRPTAPTNIAILGSWGIGKTSALNKFEHIALKEMKNINAFVARIQLNPSACVSSSDFVAFSINEIEKSFGMQSSIKMKIIDKMLTWKIKSLSFSGLKIEKKELTQHSVSVFQNSLEELWHRILGPEGIRIGVLMFDDLHYLAENYPKGLYDLRSVFQSLALRDVNFMLCITGPTALFVKIRTLAEPFARFFDKYELKSFSLDETREAITLPLSIENIDVKIDEKVIERIYELSNGHPYFIHFIMRGVLDMGSNKITLKDFDSLYPRIFSHMSRSKFSSDLDIASDKEKEVLFKIAGTDEALSFSELGKQYRSSVYRLEEKGLITKTQRGKYALYHPLFREYLRCQR
jgi:hypothetical protein